MSRGSRIKSAAADDATFVQAKARINTAIQNPVSGLGFVGAFFSLAGVTAYSWVSGLASALPASAALTCYTITLAITFGVNIPLNNALARAADSGDTGTGRKSFESRWTQWNIHRTWLSMAALVALSIAWAAL